MSHVDSSSLFRAHASFVVAFLARLGVPRQELEDALQEVFLVAHRRGGYVEGPARPTTWLAEIALRVVSTRRRTRKRRPDDTPAAGEHEAVTARTPFDALADTEALARVQRALHALPVDHRAVFILFEIDGEPCDAIAAAFGVPIGTIYSRLSAARRRFLRAYQDLDASPLPRDVARPEVP